jgi:DNA-binding MarR family transcriptional regulator
MKQRFSKNGKVLHPLSAATKAYNQFFYREESHYMVPHVFHKIMDQDEVTILCYLMNLRNVIETVAELQPGGWFYCTSSKFELDLGYERTTVWRILKRLEKKKFIQTETRGNPGKRFVRIRRKKIREACEKVYNLDDDVSK